MTVEAIDTVQRTAQGVSQPSLQAGVAEVLSAELCVARRHLDDETCSRCQSDGNRLTVEVIDLVVPWVSRELSKEISDAIIERNSRKAENVNETVYNLAFAAGLAMANQIVAETADRVLDDIAEGELHI